MRNCDQKQRAISLPCSLSKSPIEIRKSKMSINSLFQSHSKAFKDKKLEPPRLELTVENFCSHMPPTESEYIRLNPTNFSSPPSRRPAVKKAVKKSVMKCHLFHFLTLSNTFFPMPKVLSGKETVNFLAIFDQTPLDDTNSNLDLAAE
jgi:hypothetical protein